MGREKTVLAIDVVVGRVLLGVVGRLHEGQRRLTEVAELLEILDRRQFGNSCEGERKEVLRREQGPCGRGSRRL